VGSCSSDTDPDLTTADLKSCLSAWGRCTWMMVKIRNSNSVVHLLCDVRKGKSGRSHPSRQFGSWCGIRAEECQGSLVPSQAKALGVLWLFLRKFLLDYKSKKFNRMFKAKPGALIVSPIFSAFAQCSSELLWWSRWRKP